MDLKYLKELDKSIESVTRLDYSSLQISLYFFLLIFFILLNFTSNTLEPKQKTLALESINHSFNKNNFYIQPIELDLKKQNFQEAKNDYYLSIIKIIPTNYEIINKDNKLELRISKIAFFNGETDKIKQLHRLMLADIAKILAKNISGYQLNLQISMAEQNQISERNISFQTSLKLAKIKEYLAITNAPSANINLKLRTDNPYEISFIFNLAEAN
jgi:hypothetical protein